MKTPVFLAFFLALVGVLTACLLKIIFSLVGPAIGASVVIVAITFLAVISRKLTSYFEEDGN